MTHKGDCVYVSVYTVRPNLPLTSFLCEIIIYACIIIWLNNVLSKMMLVTQMAFKIIYGEVLIIIASRALI